MKNSCGKLFVFVMMLAAVTAMGRIVSGTTCFYPDGTTAARPTHQPHTDPAGGGAHVMCARQTSKAMNTDTDGGGWAMEIVTEFGGVGGFGQYTYDVSKAVLLSDWHNKRPKSGTTELWQNGAWSTPVAWGNNKAYSKSICGQERESLRL